MGILKPLFDKQKSKAAMLAAFGGDFGRAFDILETGGDINATRFIGEPGYGGSEGNIGYAAVLHGDIEALGKALDRGLNPDVHSPYRSPLVIFAIQQNREDMAMLLVERGADVSTFRLQDYLSPLSLAKIYRMEGLAALIEEKLSPEQRVASKAADLPWGHTKPPETVKRKGLNL